MHVSRHWAQRRRPWVARSARREMVEITGEDLHVTSGVTLESIWDDTKSKDFY
jgi:hypothetical protein